jgi:glycosyltransferase involved in cell wall biosynthesis
MDKPRIVIVGKVPPPFMGTSIWFETLRNSSINSYFDIHWFNVNVHKDFSKLSKSNITNIWPNIRLYFQFRSVLNNFKPGLVLIPFSQSTPGFIKDSIFIRLSSNKFKTLIMLHGSNLQNWLKYSSFWTKRYFSNTLKNANGAVVLGNNLRYLFSPWFSGDKIFVVPNGLKIENLPYSVKNGFSIIIRYIGSLSSAKGIIEIIEAILLLKNPRKQFRLILNGIWRDQEIKKRCEKIIAENLLPVNYEGEVTGEQKSLAYSNSDIFVFTPNKPEGHPMVIIEAMAAGLPIITTDQGAITESVIDGENGFIVPIKNPAAISDKLKILIENETLREQMGRRSRELYEQNLTEEKMVEHLKDVFYKVLGG